ncbi:cyclic lactone autoinducer peptide [Clostridium sediminicola]
MKNKKSLFRVAAIIFTFIAMTVSSSACVWYGYQPEEPKCLREE